MDQFKVHFRVIDRQDMKDDIGWHFNTPKHHGMDDLLIHILDFTYAPFEIGIAWDTCLQVEFNWIHALRTMLPLGLNTLSKAPTAIYFNDIQACTDKKKIIEARCPSATIQADPKVSHIRLLQAVVISEALCNTLT